MRGLVVVALGAILIWFGLSRGSGQAQGAAPDVETARASGERNDGSARGTEAGTSERALEFVPHERADDVEAEGPPIGPGAATVADTVDDAVQLANVGQGDTASIRSEASLGSADDDLPGGAVARPVVEEPVDPPPMDGAFDASRTAAASSAPRSFDDGSFEFDGAGSDDRVRLATLLLEAWLGDDAQELLTFLKHGDGADLPLARRQLCAAFWEALAGHRDAARDRLSAIEGGPGVTSSQLGLLAAALDSPGERAVPLAASASHRDPLTHAMRMMLLEDEARSLLRAREYARSAAAFSELIQFEVDAPWAPHREVLLDWGKELEKVQRNHRFAPKGAWPSIEERVLGGDSLVAVRKRVVRRRTDLDLCTGLIAAVNGVSGYVHPGDVLRIPLDPVNVVVDLDSRVLLYRHGSEVVRMWQVGIGKENHDTPIGEFRIGDKIERPAHTTKGLPYGHPDNPLGSRWLALYRDGRKTSYGIHGTSDPDGVGGEVSLGCIRMRNEEVDDLFEILPRGSRVVIQH